MRGITISSTIKLITEECCNCHVIFAIPDYMREKLIEKGNTFYCPNGHGQSYGEGEIGELRKKLNNARSRMEQAEADAERARKQRDEALKEAANQKRQRTRIANRVKNGVCPDCHRSFKNLKEHQMSCHGTKEQAAQVIKEHTSPR